MKKDEKKFGQNKIKLYLCSKFKGTKGTRHNAGGQQHNKTATNTMTITRKQIEAATEKANGIASPYKLDVLSTDGLAALMEIVWGEMDGCKIADFFDVFGSFLGRRHFSTWFDDVYHFAEAKKAAYKAQKSSTGYAELSQWYIIK